MTESTPSPLHDARQAAYRELVLSAAERAFARGGYEATRIQAVADEAGVSVGTIYSVFGSKSELYSAVLTHRLPALLDAARAGAAKATSTIESLVGGLDAYILYLLEHADYLGIHLLEHSWGIGPTRATAEQLVAYREGLDLHAKILQAAMDEGVVIRENPYRLARCIMAIHQVHLWDWVEQGMKEAPEQVAIRLRRLFVQMFCVEGKNEASTPRAEAE